MSRNIHTSDLSVDSLKLWDALVADAPNWNDQPLVTITKEQRGNLTQLKRAGLLTTNKEDDGSVFAEFTTAGYAFMNVRRAAASRIEPENVEGWQELKEGDRVILVANEEEGLPEERGTLCGPFEADSETAIVRLDSGYYNADEDDGLREVSPNYIKILAQR